MQVTAEITKHSGDVYAGIILDASEYLLCSKVCQYDLSRPSGDPNSCRDTDKVYWSLPYSLQVLHSLSYSPSHSVSPVADLGSSIFSSSLFS